MAVWLSSVLHLHCWNGSSIIVDDKLDILPHSTTILLAHVTTLLMFQRSQPTGSNDLSLQVPTISAYRFQRSQPTGSNDLSLQVPTISAYRFQRSQPTGSNDLSLHEVELSGNYKCQQSEINSYPDSLLFISTGFLPRVSLMRLNWSVIWLQSRNDDNRTKPI